MMQVFRNAAKPVIYVVTIAFFAWLVLDLSGLTGGTGLMTKTSVGKINGRGVDARAYQTMVQRALDNTQRQGNRLTLEETERLRNEVWEEFVQNSLLDEEFSRRGITVSADEVADAMRNAPPEVVRDAPEFQTGGQFDLGKYQRWLASTAAQPYLPTFEAEYRSQLLRAKLFRSLAADVSVSDPAIWERYRDQNEKVTVGMAAIGPAAIPDSAVQVSAAEVESYYKAHQDDLKRPRTAYLSYVMLNRSPNASDTAAALARAEAIRAEIAGGTPFAEVAKRESADTISAAKGGDLGEFPKGAMDPAFDAAAFSLPLDQVSAPVKSAFGFHVIQVYERSKDKAKARHILVPVELAGAHRDSIDAQADTLERLGAERLDPAALDTVARVLGLPLGSTSPVAEGGRATIGPLPVPDAGVWAFQAKVGEISPIIETSYAYYLFRVDSVEAAGVPPLTRIRLEVEAAVRAQKKMVLAKNVAKQLEARLASGQGLQASAAELKLPYDQFGPFSRLNPPFPSPILAGASFSLAQPGQYTGPIETPQGIYVLALVSRQPADSAAFVKALPQLRPELLQAARQQRVRGYMSALRESAKVDDRRQSLFRTAAQVEAATPTPGP